MCIKAYLRLKYDFKLTRFVYEARKKFEGVWGEEKSIQNSSDTVMMVINVLLTSSSPSILEVTDPRFLFPLIYGPLALRFGHKSMEK